MQKTSLSIPFPPTQHFRCHHLTAKLLGNWFVLANKNKNIQKHLFSDANHIEITMDTTLVSTAAVVTVTEDRILYNDRPTY